MALDMVAASQGGICAAVPTVMLTPDESADAFSLSHLMRTQVDTMRDWTPLYSYGPHKSVLWIMELLMENTVTCLGDHYLTVFSYTCLYCCYGICLYCNLRAANQLFPH